MAGEQQLGNIVYQVEMELGKLITSQQQVNSRLDQMEGKFDATAKSVDRAEKSMFSLSRVATSLATALSVQQIAQYGNAWVIGEYIQSSNWNGSTIGWHVNKNGDAWFNNANIRGQLTMDTTTNGIRTIVDYRGQRTYHANGQPAIICGYF
ncbi:TPA: hypothetical protein PXM46_000378 [Yersinia enterocolitica]|nr:hypothetical protein [Yersinia enterocolitica]